MNNELILQTLAASDINYFSFSLFLNNEPIISHCNNQEWLNLYNSEFNKTTIPPVQKYLTSSSLKLLIWDFCDLDKETKKYITMRNDVVNASSNMTLLFRNNIRNDNFLTTITLGTNKSSATLLDFIKTNETRLLAIKRKLVI